MIVSFQKDKEMLLVLHLPGDHGIVFRFPCPVFGGRGVQNLDQGGAFAPPFAISKRHMNQGFSAYTHLTIGRGVQGGASLNGYRGCIVRLYQN